MPPPPTPPAKISPGQPIRADWLNQLVDLAAAGAAGVGGVVGGGGPDNGVRGVVAAMAAAMPEEWIQCRVIAVHAPTGAQGARLPAFPSQVRYTVAGTRRSGVLLSMALPSLWRSVEGDEAKVWPARVGDICYIVRSPARDNSGTVQADLVVIEAVARKACGTGVGGAIGAVPERLPPVIVPPVPGPGRLTSERAGIVGSDGGKTTGGVGGGGGVAGGDAGGGLGAGNGGNGGSASG